MTTPRKAETADPRRRLRLDEAGVGKTRRSSRPRRKAGASTASAMKSFVKFLERKLCRTGPRHLRFAKVGPRSFLFASKRDMIFVKVSDDNLILVTDGELVVDHIEMHFLPFRNMPAGDDDEDLFDHYLQEILQLF